MRGANNRKERPWKKRAKTMFWNLGISAKTGDGDGQSNEKSASGIGAGGEKEERNNCVNSFFCMGNMAEGPRRMEG